MTNVIHIIIGVSAISILVGSIFLYFRWKSIKALNKLNRKAMCIHIPDFIDPNPIKVNRNTTNRRRILCSGHFEMLKKQKNNSQSLTYYPDDTL